MIMEEFMNRSREDAGPPNKRMRVISKACENCKQKKSRCDSGRPQCENCRRRNIPCIYREKGQPGLRPGYGKSLEQRLNVLEENMENMADTLREVLDQTRALVMPSNGPTIMNTDVTNDRPPGTSLEWPQDPEVQDTIDVSSGQSMTRVRDAGRLEWDLETGLPPDHIIKPLVDLFFEHIHSWTPLFYKANFINKLHAPERQLLLHGVVVLSFRHWTLPEPSREGREAYVRKSREDILLKTIDACSIISTQALALLAIDAIGQGPGPRTWNIMAMLTTAAQQLGLARNVPLDVNDPDTPLVRNEDVDDTFDLSAIEAEEKRRLFWVIYGLDRYSSVSLGQPGGICTKSIKIAYPTSEIHGGQVGAAEWFQAASPGETPHTHFPLDLWHYLIDLLALVDKSNHLLIQPINLSLPTQCHEWQAEFRRLDVILTRWFEALPQQARGSPDSFDPMWIMVHATFHLIRMRMYTVAAFPSTTSSFLRPSSSARGRLRQEIRSVATLCTLIEPQHFPQLGPMFAFVVWVAARSMVILWTSGYENTYGPMPTDLESLLNVLRPLGQWWPCAQRHMNMIQLILKTRNNPGGPTGIEIFNDTRRTAYGLQNQLGRLAERGNKEVFPQEFDLLGHSFDFLDMPIFDGGDRGFGFEIDGEWL